jgi:prepilin-type N-terminal cleavage/methylation domain-containing protein
MLTKLKLGQRASPACRRSAFTLTEILVAMTLIGLVATGSFWALITSNRQAGASRLFTTAQAIAQNEIELIETDGPFNPQASPNPQIPLSLAIGIWVKPNVVIYVDPVNANVIVTGTKTIEVSDPGFTLNGLDLHMRQVTVRLDYNYVGHAYVVKTSTLRTSDL